MTTIECPRCGYQLSTPSSAASTASQAPDPSVTRWFGDGVKWSGEISTAEVYGDYLTSVGEAPVSRSRFVSDLAYLGVEEVLDGDTRVLVLD